MEEPVFVISPDEQRQFETIYPEICSSYHAIREMRAKLLSFLPLITSGIFLLLTGVNPRVQLGIGCYGFLVTWGLYFYEKANMNHLYHLIYYGSALETAVNIKQGQFTLRKEFLQIKSPGDWIRQSGVAAGFIYGATLFAWAIVGIIGVIGWFFH